MQLNRTVRPEELRREICSLEGREGRLQMAALVFMLVILVGTVVATLGIDSSHLPAVFLGFIVLGVLFSFVLYHKRGALAHAREELVRKVLGCAGAENLSLVDPLTGILNRRYLDRYASKEIGIAERVGLSLTLLMINVQGFESLRARFGRAAGDRVLIGIGELLRKNFRDSDTLIRYGDDAFLVLMLGCKEQQARDSAKRLLAEVDRWNGEKTDEGYKVTLRYSTAAYANHTSIAPLLETLDQQMGQDQCDQPASDVESSTSEIASAL